MKRTLTTILLLASLSSCTVQRGQPIYGKEYTAGKGSVFVYTGLSDSHGYYTGYVNGVYTGRVGFRNVKEVKK